MKILNDLKARQIPHAVLAPEILGNFAGYYVCVPKEYALQITEYPVLKDGAVLSIPIEEKHIRQMRQQLQYMKMTLVSDYGCVFEPKNANFRRNVGIKPERKKAVKKVKKQYYGYKFKPLWRKEAV